MRTAVTTAIGPDPTLMPRPGSIATSGASSVSLGSYTYDGVGNITTFGSDTFSYDTRSRLISATLPGTGSQSYTYDLFGNLLTKGGTTFCISTCTNNRLPGPSYAYDGRGNLTNSPGENYGYDAMDRTITSSSGWAYLYDGSGERVVRIPPPTGLWTYTFRDEGARVSTEFSGPTPSIDNVFLANQVVASYANGGVGGNDHAWAFYTSDHLGTPRVLTDVSGGIFETRKYWPYGEQAAGASSLERLRFATMERDPEAGPNNDRYFDHARHHASGLGRFLSPDEIGGSPEEPQSWNRYAYASNNPVNTVDPLGLSPEEGSEFGCGYEDEECTTTRPGSQQESVTVTAPSFVETLIFGGVSPYLSFVTGSDNDPRQLLKDVSLIGLNSAGPLLKGLPVGLSVNRILGVRFNPARTGHIFREAVGHVNPGTLASQSRFVRIFQKIASNTNNFRPDFPLPAEASGAGVEAFSQTFRGGNQVWVLIRNDEIVDAGVNAAEMAR